MHGWSHLIQACHQHIYGAYNLQPSTEAMKQLLKNHPMRSFSILKNLIKNKTREIKQYEELNTIEFESQMHRFILNTHSHQKKIDRIVQNYERLCLTAAKPIESILKEFLNHGKKYDEDDIVQTAVFLAKAYQLSLSDHGGNLDRFGYRLFESPMFDHFVEEVKYALSDKVYMQHHNVANILEALCDVNYADIEILKLAMVKVENLLEVPAEDRIKFEPRLYQIEKANYYKNDILNFDKAILANEKFQKNLNYFIEKNKQYANRLIHKNLTNFNEKQGEIVHDLLSQFEKFNKGAQKMVEAVIGIRQQYLKLVTISSNQKVLRNPELNDKALQIEEKLVELRLISIYDIQEPSRIANEQEEFKNVEEVVKILMSEFNLDEFEMLFVQEKPDLSYIEVKKQRDLKEMASVINAVARYAALPFRLNGKDNRISLLNNKWQRYFLEEKFSDNNVEVQRLFRKAFLEGHTFLQRLLPTIELNLIEAEFSTKLLLFSAMIRMGFQKELVRQFKSLKITPSILKDIPSGSILSFVKVVNHINEYITPLSPQTNQLIEGKLEQIFHNQKWILSLDNLPDIINYLYRLKSQQGKEEANFNLKLYKNLVSLLAQEVQLMESSGAANELTLREGKRILQFDQTGDLNQASPFELSNIYGSHPNPFLQTLYSTFSPPVAKPEYHTPYILTGIVRGQQLSGLYVADSDCSSLDGEFVSGNIHAYCLRLSQHYGVKVMPVSLLKFLQVKLTDGRGFGLGWQTELKMKESAQVLQTMEQFMPESSKQLAQFIKGVTGVCEYLVQLPKAEYKMKRIISAIKKIVALYKEEKQIYFVGQFYVKRCHLLAQIKMLGRNFTVFTAEEKKVIEEQLNKSIQSSKKVTIEQFINNLHNQLAEQLPATREFLTNLEKQKQKHVFMGKRTTLDIIAEPSAETAAALPVLEHPEYQLLSLPYIRDTRYIEYKDWEDKVKAIANYNEIDLNDASNLTKLLVMKFLPNVRETLVTLPDPSGEFMVPLYPLNWQNKYHYYQLNAKENDQLEQIAQDYRKAFENREVKQDAISADILAIQNMKRQIKVSQTPKEIIANILECEFIDELLEERLNYLTSDQTSPSREGVEFLPRDAEEYFRFLERKVDKIYLQSPYLEYIFNKIQEVQGLKQKVQERKDNKARLNMLFSQGSIDKNQYYARMKKIDENLLEQMKKLKRKSLTHVEGVQIGEVGSKIVQLTKKIEDLERIISNASYYDILQDNDFIAADNNFDLALEFKRARTENNLILFRILYKVSQNAKLTLKQKKFHAIWKKNVAQNLAEYRSSRIFTTKKLANLSQADQVRLNLQGLNQNLSLSDIILQLSHFFDHSVIGKLENVVVSEQLSELYKVPISVFSSHSNKTFNKYTYEIEDKIMQDKSQLNSQEINCLLELSQVFKTEGLSDRFRYNEHFKDLRVNLELINKCRYRNPLAAQYLKQKDEEYYSNYYPEYAKELKQRNLRNFRKELFDTTGQPTDTKQIRHRVDQICKRMLLLKLNTPAFFNQLVLDILTNPKADLHSKQKLIAHIELFKIPLKLDSDELLGLAQPEVLPETEQLMEKLRKVSGSSFASTVSTFL